MSEVTYQKMATDVFYHLELLKTDLARVQLNWNNDYHLALAMNKFNDSCEIIENLIRRYDNNNFRKLTRLINEVLINDTELNGVNVLVKKEQKLSNFDYSKVALIVFTI